jgi:hypothetical protein
VRYTVAAAHGAIYVIVLKNISLLNFGLPSQTTVCMFFAAPR